MQFLAKTFECDLEVLDHRITVVLAVKSFFASAIDRVLQKIIETSNAGGLLLFDERFATGRNEQRLHVTLGLRQVKEMSPVHLGTHLNKLSSLVPAHVGKTASRNVEMGVSFLFCSLDDLIGEFGNQSESFGIDRRKLARRRRSRSWCTGK